jgi:V8-like Glu-specific endopeptidase
MKFNFRPLCALVALPLLSASAQDLKFVAPTATANPVVSDQTKRDAVQAYWTPEMLATARPMPIPQVDPASLVSNNAPSTPEPVHFSAPGLPTIHSDAEIESSTEAFPLNQGLEAGALATPSPDAFNYEMPFNNFRTQNNKLFPYTAIGKLFFTIPAGTSQPAGNYVCSAAVSGTSNIVVTARHCMWDYVSQKWYSNFVFYPGWNNGLDSTLKGAWFPEWVSTWTSGTGVLSLNTGWDIGIMVMEGVTRKGCGASGGNAIGVYTGWLGWTYGGDFTQRQWDIFGYPQAPPFEGNYLYQDDAATGAFDPLGTTNVVEAGDPQTGGTSGGPWVIGFNPSNGPNTNPNNNTSPGFYNLENGVNSFQWTSPSEPLAINGTIFQAANFFNLYTYAKGLKCS